VPLAAPLRYTGEERGKIQRLFKYLHARRACRKLAAGEVVVQSLDEGYLPSGVRNIVQLSKHNLGLLRRALAPLSQAEKALHETLRGLPFRLKHATTAASWANIYNAGLIFSKDALADWNIVVPTNTPGSDELYKQDVDFAFFRVEVGEENWVSRFGADDDQQRVVFDWQRLLDDGWVSLHDMLAPLGSREPRSELRTRDGDELVRISAPDMDLQGERKSGSTAFLHRHAPRARCTSSTRCSTAPTSSRASCCRRCATSAKCLACSARHSLTPATRSTATG